MKPKSIDGDVVWLSPTELATEYNKTRITIYRWCSSGFILTLGYRLKREANRRYSIGVPVPEYSTFVTRHLTPSHPLVLSLPREHSTSGESRTSRS